MRLVRFKVTNFRSVVDSGWIEVERVTALVGINESGKTNLLLPLWKLRPARDGEIKPTSDYPKSNYAAVKADPAAFDFICAEFDCSALAERLADATGRDRADLGSVQVSRNFKGEYSVTFPQCHVAREADAVVVGKLINDAKTELNGMTSLAKEASLKTELLAALDAAGKASSGDGALSTGGMTAWVTRLEKAVPETPAPTSSIVPRYKRLLESLREITSLIEAVPPEEVRGVKDLVIKELPSFVYYSNYGNLDSEIYLPHVVENMKRERDLGAREASKARTLRVLFSFVRLQPQEILALGRDFRDAPGRAPTESEIAVIAVQKRERTILLNSAGSDLTRRFGAWWKQGNYTFEFQADGDHFRIWVSDSKRPEKVELEDRSTGLQWFFSFYLVFLVESEHEHQHSILLLDEPGLSLHPLAQRDLSAFFDGLAETNQIIYTTHSPFLVDADMLDRARKVYMGDDGSTKASADLRRGSADPRSVGATYAIYSALNMNVAESILFGCHPIIVEGPSDQHYLSAIKALLIGSKSISPKREIVFLPSHGASSAKVIASILAGRNDELPFILLDGDAAGRKMAKDMQNASYQAAKERVVLTDTAVGFEGSEIEDLFPAAFMADVIDRWERRPETLFADCHQAGKPIVPQIEAWAKTHSTTLAGGWKVDLARLVKARALANPNSFDAACLSRWATLFAALGVT